MMKSEECRVKSEAHWTVGDVGPSPRPVFVYKLKNSSIFLSNHCTTIVQKNFLLWNQQKTELWIY